MGIGRFVVETGEKVASFFATDMQNVYYKYMFYMKDKKIIGKKNFQIDKNYQHDCKKYWRNTGKVRIKTLWHDFYSSVNGIKDVRYIPENIWHSKIEPHYNRIAFSQCCDDKCYYPERFPENAVMGGVHRPRLILRNINGYFYTTKFEILTPTQAADILAGEEQGYVIKESITGRGGNRILFVEPGEKKTQQELLQIFEKYSRDFVVEGLLQQCDEIASLNPTSVNTIRFITFLNQEGAHLLSACVRMGGINSRTDNFSTGGIACGVNEDGILKKYAYDKDYNQYTIHPNGCGFAGKKIPNYQEALDLVLTLHRRFGHFRVISWDIVINQDHKPAVMEFNLTPQGIDVHQINNGPLFGNYTDEMINEVFK